MLYGHRFSLATNYNFVSIFGSKKGIILIIVCSDGPTCIWIKISQLHTSQQIHLVMQIPYSDI